MVSRAPIPTRTWPSIGSRLHEPVLEVAVRMFTATGALDLRAVAVEAGVGRATLYRRYGDRDSLLGEVLWELVRASMLRARSQASGTGAEHIVQTLRRTMTSIIDFPALRTLLDRTPETALRILTSREGCVQERVIRTIDELIVSEEGEPVGISSRQLAYALVRVAESFCYADVIAGLPPDTNAATEIMRRLLR